MRLHRLLPALVVTLALSVICADVSLASKADELLSQAERAASRAKAAQNSADRDENYKKALETYGEIAKDYANTLQAVQAVHAVAMIHQEAKGEYHDPRAAYDAYARLISTYDKKPSELEERFERAEVREIQRLVASAKVNRTKLSDELDKQNSGQILYKIMDFFVGITGRIPWFSYWFAIIIVTLIVKLLITPLTKAQFKAMKEMQNLSPLVKDIQAKHKGDQKTIGEKTMALYKEHKVNPFASCLPILIQMPILMLLYYMIRSYEFKFAEATFLWIGSGLSHLASFVVPFSPGTTVWVTAANLAEPDLVLVLLYVVSMYISTKLSAVDPTQAEQQKMMAIVMPVMFAFIFAGFPSAFLLYWLVFNVIQTAQQYLILHGGPRPDTGGAGSPAVPEVPPSGTDSSEGGDSSRRVRRRRRR